MNDDVEFKIAKLIAENEDVKEFLETSLKNPNILVWNIRRCLQRAEEIQKDIKLFKAIINNW